MSLMFVFVILVKDQVLPQASWEIKKDLEFDNIFKLCLIKSDLWN